MIQCDVCKRNILTVADITSVRAVTGRSDLVHGCVTCCIRLNQVAKEAEDEAHKVRQRLMDREIADIRAIHREDSSV